MNIKRTISLLILTLSASLPIGAIGGAIPLNIGNYAPAAVSVGASAPAVEAVAVVAKAATEKVVTATAAEETMVENLYAAARNVGDGGYNLALGTTRALLLMARGFSSAGKWTSENPGLFSLFVIGTAVTYWCIWPYLKFKMGVGAKAYIEKKTAEELAAKNNVRR